MVILWGLELMSSMSIVTGSGKTGVVGLLKKQISVDSLAGTTKLHNSHRQQDSGMKINHLFFRLFIPSLQTTNNEL